MKTHQTTVHEYPIKPTALNSRVQQAVMCLRKDGFSASWLDGVLRTTATRGQVAMSCGMSLDVI